TSNRTRLDTARILISTTAAEQIANKLKIKVKGKSFLIWVSEEEARVSLFKHLDHHPHSTNGFSKDHVEGTRVDTEDVGDLHSIHSGRGPSRQASPMKRGRPISPELCNGSSGQADPPRFSHTTQPRLSSRTATANHGVGIFGSPKSVDVQGTHVAPDPNDEAGGGRQKIPAFKEVQPQSSKDDAAVPNPKAVMEGGRQSVSFPNQAHSEVAANRATAVNVQHGFSSVVPDSNAAGVGGRHAASTSNDVHVETDTDAHAVSASTRNPDGHSGSSSDLPVSFAAGVGGRQADSPSNEAHVDTATEAQAV
ncbi:hypothetical protein Ancab_039278, partial [Ancistrocladus abbreviatus]